MEHRTWPRSINLVHLIDITGDSHGWVQSGTASWKTCSVSRTWRDGSLLFKNKNKVLTCLLILLFICLYLTNCFLSCPPPTTPTTSSCARPVLSIGIMVSIHEFLLNWERGMRVLVQSREIRICQTCPRCCGHQRIVERATWSQSEKSS